MQNAEKRDTLPVDQGWISCPICRRNRRLLRVEPDTEARNLRVWCRSCKSEVVLDIERGQSVKRQSP